MTEHRVECGICHESFRPIPSQIRLVCNGCSGVDEIIAEILKFEKGLLEKVKSDSRDGRLTKSFVCNTLREHLEKEIEKWKALI